MVRTPQRSRRCASHRFPSLPLQFPIGERFVFSNSASATLRGIDGQRVQVEVHVVTGVLPSFSVVGLPDASCREARDRVRAALSSNGFAWPKAARVTVNLAPSQVRKEGSGLDLAIALGVIAASTLDESRARKEIEDGVERQPEHQRLPPELLLDHAFIAELGLDGSLRPVPGVLSRVAAVSDLAVVVAPAAAHEARLAGAAIVRSAGTLRQVVDCLKAVEPWPDPPRGSRSADHRPPVPDLADVAGHPFARQALEIAAAGGHNLLLCGPPGAGKSMLARRLPGILPDLDDGAALLTSRIHSVAGLGVPANDLLRVPPFRAPHHSASMTALIGGGSGRLRPGEISCAHGGVLFLDELGEFAPSALDAMRQPLEEGSVQISRAHASVRFPARFCLVAAMNPCPCGLLGSVEPCRCTDQARRRYMRRLSGPLLDRIDLRVHMQRPRADQLMSTERGESSGAVRDRVLAARERARRRGVPCNARIVPGRLDDLAPVSDTGRTMLERALADGRLSARGLARVRMVARTIADLAGEDTISEQSIAGALALRARPVLFDTLGVTHV